MKIILSALAVMMMSNLSLAAIKCSDDDQSITIDPHHKQVSILKDGHTTKLKIISRNHHAYQMFGDKTYEVQGGYILGLKTSSSQKNLTVFKDGAPVTTVKDCSL